MESLAVRYRPHEFSQVVEQGSAKIILQQQLESGEIQHAYLFTGSQGVGKTTIGRIFANEINKGVGKPIEIDAASNSSVENVRNIIQQSKVQSMDGEYRIWLIDECHALSSSGWQAFLKILEEPPSKAVFLFCTTNPEKVPRTIISRVQRFDFKRISQQGIIDRLKYILDTEKSEGRELSYTEDAISYLARISEGGLRDSITLTDKCLAYNTDLTLENVIQALGTVDYEVFFKLSDAILNKDSSEVIKVIESVHADGKDLKQFIKDYMSFLLDINKYDILHNFDYLQIPNTYENVLQKHTQEWFNVCRNLLHVIVKLNADLKWETQPRISIESKLLEVVL